MRLLISIIVVLCFNLSIANAQRLKWDAKRPLTWADFNGKPDYGSNMAAVAYWKTYYTFKRELRDSIYAFTFSIENSFDSKASWVKRGSISNEYLLKHEKLHFDINELFARKLALAFRSALFTENYKAEIETIYNKYQAQSLAMESQYDRETEHSNNEYMQYRWELFIYTELQKLPRNY